MFAIANTLPNSMYILLAGGVLNTVLVPQLVRAVRRDADGGSLARGRTCNSAEPARWITIFLVLPIGQTRRT